jgi:predicted aconitase with swiveling domain
MQAIGRVRILAGTSCQAAFLRLAEPLSFWGGVDSATGAVIDRHHPQHGMSLAGRVVWLPAGRGSSSSSSVLLECARLGTAPAALLLQAPDMVLSGGAEVAFALYGRGPLLAEVIELVPPADGSLLRIERDGTVRRAAPTAD